MRAYHDEVCVPSLSGIYTVHFKKMFGMAGKPKTAEQLLLTGPYGKYLLKGCFYSPLQKIVFEDLGLLGALSQCGKTRERLKKLEHIVPIVLAEVAIVLLWELDMNRHSMVHLV